MREGSVYQRKSDKRWVAQFEDVTGTTRYLYRKTKAAAKHSLREALAERDAGMVPVGKMTLNDLLDSWLEDLEGTVSRRTMVHRESIYRVHIRPTIGSERLSKLTHKDFQRLYRNKIAEGLKPSTVKCIHAVLKQWRGSVDLSNEDLLKPDISQEKCSEVDYAKTWIADKLKDGPVQSTAIEAMAEEDGISKSTLNRAKGLLPVKSKKVGTAWCWLLVKGSQDRQETQGSQAGNVGHVDNVVALTF